MATYQEFQQQFAQALVGVSPQADAIFVMLEALIDALPYYGDPDCEKAHRGALANLLAVNLPNQAIGPQPNESGMGYNTSYKYTGPYSGYTNAFFHGIGQSAAAAAVAAAVQAVNASLDGASWGKYGVAVLTDAIRQVISLSLDTSKLASDLATGNKSFLPALSASYLAVLQKGYSPTASALNAIDVAGMTSQACSELKSAIIQGQFTANLNQAISMGGDSTNAAVWFLFNLWITLTALGDADVDGDIQQFQSAGLNVPSQIGPTKWWDGSGYISWYIPLSGSDLMTSASAMITASMPEQKVDTFTTVPPALPITSNINLSNGYSQSLCSWGSLNWYIPAPSSCFGKGTGVLMPDGSVKPIEAIQVGEEVRSNLGPKKVVLVEQPRRSGRTLYQLNDLDVFATSAHPFRAASASGPLRMAVDPWALIDAIPTMAAEGVGALTVGARLAAVGPSDPKEVKVEHLRSSTVAPAVDESVYDLLLEGGETGKATYYVGGPQTFFAVDAETADPLHDLPSTLAIVSAMEVALASCRQYVRDPATELSSLLARVKLDDIVALAREAAWSLLDGKLTRPAIPGPSYYMRNDRWDPHASMLEGGLVRQFGRRLQRESAMGWRTRASMPAPGDHFAVCVHDIGLLGEVPIPDDARVELQLHLRGWTLSEDTVRTMAIAGGTKPSWHLAAGTVIDFGRIQENVGPATLVGTVLLGGRLLGRLRATVTQETLRGEMAEPFIFDPAGKVVGRIALEQRRVSGRDLVIERRLRQRWTHRHATAMAISMGRQIGHRLVAFLESEKVRGNRE